LIAKKILLALIFLCYGYSYASTLNITADNKVYDKDTDILTAKGTVTVEGHDFRIISQDVIQYFKEDKIIVSGNFEFEKEGYRVSGSSLVYYYERNEGKAKNVRVNFGETFLGSKDLVISNEAFEMRDAYFTGCNAPASHYHFSADQVTFHPNTGLIVAYHATCFVGTLPILPLPMFVISTIVPDSTFITKNLLPVNKTRAEAIVDDARTTQTITQLGYNPVDGDFVRQGFNWYFTPKTYARLLVSYMGTNHFGAGLSTNYILGDNDEGEFRFNKDEVEKFNWGWTHYFSFGANLLSEREEKKQVYDLYHPGGKYSYELETKYSVSERINLDVNTAPFSRVSFTPKITLRSNRKPVPLLGDSFTYFAEASYANVSEEVSEFETTSQEGFTQSSSRTNYYTDITYTGDLGVLGDLKAVIDLSLSDYGRKLGSWDTSRQQIYLRQNYLDKFLFEYGHVHYILQRGYSPYVFEGYYYSPYDQFVGGVAFNAWFSTIKFSTSYSLPAWDLDNIKYELLLGMHCYNLLFSYEMRNRGDTFSGVFNFSIELVPSRW
jgi:hypothetical protein